MQTEVFFFDIDGTLGDVQLLSEEPLLVKEIKLYPAVSASLERLRKAKCRLGIISNIGTASPDAVKHVKAALSDAKILDYFDENLLAFGKKDSTAVFKSAIQNAGFSEQPNACAFVGEDEAERRFALLAGMASLHPAAIIWS